MSLLTNILAYYKLDESSGNATDEVSSQTLVDNGSVGTTTGKLNGARNFDGASNYLGYSTNLLNGKSEYSASLWARLDRGSSNFRQDTLFKTYDNSVGDGTKLDLDGTPGGAKLRFTKTKSYSSGSVTADAVIAVSTWYHIACTVSATGVMTLYINGVAQTATDTKTGSLTNTTAFTLGEDPAGANWWLGPIDEFGLWSRELTSSEVTQLYNSGTPLAYSSFGGGGGSVGMAAVRPIRQSRNKSLVRR